VQEKLKSKMSTYGCREFRSCNVEELWERSLQHLVVVRIV
jgi:hypothetical protein